MNSTAIILRIKEILEHYHLTPSNFADTIDVQRSSISHLLSGRNKPSLDFVLKIVDKFPDVDLYWLLNGIGIFPKKNEATPISEIKEPINSKIESPSLFSQNEPQVESISNTRFSDTKKKLIKVVLLYNDGSFEEFNK